MDREHWWWHRSTMLSRFSHRSLLGSWSWKYCQDFKRHSIDGIWKVSYRRIWPWEPSDGQMDGPGRRKATRKTCMQMESGKFHVKDSSKGKEQEVVGCMNNLETSCTTCIVSCRGTTMHHMHWMLRSLVHRGANPWGTDLIGYWQFVVLLTKQIHHFFPRH